MPGPPENPSSCPTCFATHTGAQGRRATHLPATAGQRLKRSSLACRKAGRCSRKMRRSGGTTPAFLIIMHQGCDDRIIILPALPLCYGPHSFSEVILALTPLPWPLNDPNALCRSPTPPQGSPALYASMHQLLRSH